MYLNTLIGLVILAVLYGITWHNQPARRPAHQDANPDGPQKHRAQPLRRIHPRAVSNTEKEVPHALSHKTT